MSSRRLGTHGCGSPKVDRRHEPVHEQDLPTSGAFAKQQIQPITEADFFDLCDGSGVVRKGFP